MVLHFQFSSPQCHFYLLQTFQLTEDQFICNLKWKISGNHHLVQKDLLVCTFFAKHCSFLVDKISFTSFLESCDFIEPDNWSPRDTSPYQSHYTYTFRGGQFRFQLLFISRVPGKQFRWQCLPQTYLFCFKKILLISVHDCVS